MRRRRFIALLCWVAAPALWPPSLFAQADDQHHHGQHRRTPSLSAAQREAIWHDLSVQAGKAEVPSGLNVGEVVPDTMNLLRFARHLRKTVPAIRGYRYTLLKDEVLLVDPDSRKIVAIIGK